MLLRTAVCGLALVACGPDEVIPDQPDAGNAACRFHTAADDVAAPPIVTPRWAFHPWISKDISDAADTRAFVQGFADRDIPVGTVVLDSPWETYYNTFVPNPARYPGFADLVAELHARDVRVVLWITQMVNRSSIDLEPGGDVYDGPAPNFAEGRDCNFFVDQDGEFYWWKGIGSGLDFFNPDAVGWWHRLQDPLYAIGVDGWKLDFGDEYVPGPMVTTAAGDVDHQAYSERYYEDFYAYGSATRGSGDFVTMVRPYDRSYGFPGRFYARPEHAPVAWVGDNRRDWLGLADALDHMFRSAQAGYAVVGSDIGGYLDRDDEDLTGPILPFDTLVFARWTAVGALGPFMQLHGRANITPWTVPDHVDETVALYRYWAKLHDQLVPFWFGLATAAHAGGPPVMQPVGDEASWPGDYRYLLGAAFLVAPVLDATGTRDVALPAGRWYDWWQPGAAAITGGTTLAGVTSARDRVPLYVRDGAIVPAVIADASTGLDGSAARADALTVLIWPADAQTSFAVAADDGTTVAITAQRQPALSIALGATAQPTYLRIRHELPAPTAVDAGGTALAAVADAAALDAAADGWFYDAATRSLWVKLAPGPAVTISTP